MRRAACVESWKELRLFHVLEGEGRHRKFEAHLRLVPRRGAGEHEVLAAMIHNTKNLIQVPRKIHPQCLTKIRNSIKAGSFLGVAFKAGQGSVTKQLQRLSYQQQYDFGVRLLQHCGVKL